MSNTAWMKPYVVAMHAVLLVGVTASVGARAEDVLKIGVAISQSGTFVREGQFLLEGYELWAEKANAAGGVKVGDKTYKVQLVSYDDESQAQTSAKLTERLISSDKVQFLFGPYSSGIANATAAISERYKMLTLDPMATANNLFTRGYKYFFCPAALGNTGLWPILELTQHVTPKPQTVAIVGPDDLFPNNNAAGAKEKAEQLGMKVVYTAKYPKGAPDLSAVATGIKSANPDLVLGSGYSQDSILLIKSLRELQVAPKAIGLATAVAVPDFRTALGSSAEGILGVDYWSPTLTYSDRYFKNSQQFADEFQKRFNHPPYYHSAAGTATGIILQDAIEKARSGQQRNHRSCRPRPRRPSTGYGVREGQPNGLPLWPFAAREMELSWTTWVPPHVRGKPLGWMSQEDWESTIDTLKQYGGVSAVPKAADLYTNAFVPEGNEFVPPQS